MVANEDETRRSWWKTTVGDVLVLEQYNRGHSVRVAGNEGTHPYGMDEGDVVGLRNRCFDPVAAWKSQKHEIEHMGEKTRMDGKM